jgi:hypothetical protein
MNYILVRLECARNVEPCYFNYGSVLNTDFICINLCGVYVLKIRTSVVKRNNSINLMHILLLTHRNPKNGTVLLIRELLYL